MAIAADVESVLKAKFEAVLPHLDERAARLVLAAEARVLGHGGVAAVARALGRVALADPGRGERAGVRGGPGGADQAGRWRPQASRAGRPGAAVGVVGVGGADPAAGTRARPCRGPRCRCATWPRS